MVPDLQFIQINTDGISIRVKRSHIHLIQEVCNQLTKETTLQIEDAYYSKMIIQDVNNYIAVYEDSTKENEYIKGLFILNIIKSSRKLSNCSKNYFVYL